MGSFGVHQANINSRSVLNKTVPEKIDTSLWVDRYGDTMYRYTLVRVQDSGAAEEIVQTAFFAALQAKESFAGRSSEKSWLFGILKHKIMDHFRAKKKTFSLDLSSEDPADPYSYDAAGHWKQLPQNWNIDPEKAVENKQLAEALSSCLEGLSEKFRRIFILREIEGLSSEEICNEFNIKPTNLWVMLHRARNQLKKCLEARWFNKK